MWLVAVFSGGEKEASFFPSLLKVLFKLLYCPSRLSSSAPCHELYTTAPSSMIFRLFMQAFNTFTFIFDACFQALCLTICCPVRIKEEIQGRGRTRRSCESWCHLPLKSVTHNIAKLKTHNWPHQRESLSYSNKSPAPHLISRPTVFKWAFSSMVANIQNICFLTFQLYGKFHDSSKTLFALNAYIFSTGIIMTKTYWRRFKGNGTLTNLISPPWPSLAGLNSPPPPPMPNLTNCTKIWPPSWTPLTRHEGQPLTPWLIQPLHPPTLRHPWPHPPADAAR